MKQLLSIKNNLISFKEIELSSIDPTLYFYVELWNNDGIERYSEVFVCNDKNIFKQNKFEYNHNLGMYNYFIGNTKQYLSLLKTSQSKGDFPYHLVKKSYNCFSSLPSVSFYTLNFTKFEELQQLKSLKYTFGLEYETSKGFIPEEKCFQNGLIPVYDGSINGLEYTSIVLNNNTITTLLRKQLEDLSLYTEFNRDCSLHIHCGGYPVNIEAVYTLYLICLSIENDLTLYNCPAVFNTDLYKQTGKNYCKAYKEKLSYTEFCKAMSDGISTSLTNLYNQHPSDNAGEHKWNIKFRYFWVNFINILFFDRNKTVEFRFLRPTYNFNKIMGWIYIFNAILSYAEIESINLKKDYDNYKRKKIEAEKPIVSSWSTYYNRHITKINTLQQILIKVYSNNPKLLKQLLNFLSTLHSQHAHEQSINDYSGEYENTSNSSLFLTDFTLYDV